MELSEICYTFYLFIFLFWCDNWKILNYIMAHIILHIILLNSTVRVYIIRKQTSVTKDT